MDDSVKALPLGEPAKPTQISAKIYQTDRRDRIAALFTLLFCVLLADTLLWYGPGAGLTGAVFAWYVLILAYVGLKGLYKGESRLLLVANLLLASTLALGSNWMFRLWNLLALLALLPIHAFSIGGGAQLPWWQPGMLWERCRLLFKGLFCNLGAIFSVAASANKKRSHQRVLAIALGTAASLSLLFILVPLLASADALFDIATANMRLFFQTHLHDAVFKLIIGILLTPFIFGLLYCLRRPQGVKAKATAIRRADGVLFLIILVALDVLYLLFLLVQSAGLFGGPGYLAQRGISYAQWARSGFFQMVRVTVLNLTIILAAVTLSHRTGGSWKAVRILASLLTAESLLLLASATWRMSLYVSAYGLSFKRCMTYWGMAMMGIFLLTALWKIWKPNFSFCRVAFGVALCGWLVISCVPIDFLVAKDNVDRYLSGESATVSVHYLAYSLSYDTLTQLERLDTSQDLCKYEGNWWLAGETLEELIARRRTAAAEECSRWQTWSLSACFAAGGQ